MTTHKHKIDINLFNQYLGENNAHDNITDKLNIASLNPEINKAQQKNILISAYDKIVNSSGSLQAVSSSLTNVNAGVTNEVADASFNDIKAKHKHIAQLRGELDAKLKELYVTDDSLAYEQQRMFDGTIYTSLIWTVLATTTLFYVFKKI